MNRPISWWAIEVATVGALIAFFFLVFHVLALVAPERMPL